MKAGTVLGPRPRIAYHEAGSEQVEATVNEKVRALLQQQTDRIAYLRATGPNPFDYFLWADYANAVVSEAFGAASAAAQAFEEAVYERGRTIDQRGLYDNMTLGLHGEWGIWARLERAERVLQELTGERSPTTSSVE